VKRTALIKKIKKAAKAADLGYESEEGARHTKVTIGKITTTVPRHSEIGEYTAEAICKQLEDELGKGWWR
jgi:hypothetical protein